MVEKNLVGTMQMNFDFLTQETLELSESMAQERLDQKKSTDTNHTEEITYPESAGIIYCAEFGGSTFCVRGVCSENLARSFSDLKENNSELYKKLKLHYADFLKIEYFETSSFEMAQVIYEQLINRRLPFCEEVVCNISDPGFSWWMDIEQSGFQVYFRSFGSGKSDNSIKLGPIGDRSLASRCFKQVRGYLERFMIFKEYSIDDGSLRVEVVDPNNPSYILLTELFTFGACEDLFNQLHDEEYKKTLYWYFKELEVVRSFWLKIEEKLALEQILKQM